MLFTTRLKLLSPMLGHRLMPRQGHGVPYYAFVRDPKTQLITLDNDVWPSLWEAVFHMTSFYPRAVNMQRKIAPLSTAQYDLRNRRKDCQGGGIFVTQHECIRAGAVITLAGRVRVTIDPDEIQAAERDSYDFPDIEDVRKGLDIIGTDFGISPYAKHRDFGRFKVLEITIHNDQMQTSSALVERVKPDSGSDDSWATDSADSEAEIDSGG